jgi:uncharacterized protein with HEPN domain
MLDSTKEAMAFAAGKTRKDLDKNRMLSLALVKSIEIIGEAATKVSEQGKTGNPEIPWIDIINMRHRLIHTYFDVNLDIVWQTVSSDLPDLVGKLEKIIQTEEI